MNLMGNPILKPLFNAIARLPLIEPHVREEVALLRSGSKPVGMFAPTDPAVAELQNDVDAGRLLRLDVPRILPRAMTIYALPGTDMDTAQQAALFQMKASGEGPSAYPQGRDALKTLASQSSVSMFHQPDGTSAAEFIDGQHTVLFVPDYMEHFLVRQGLKDEFNTRVNDGRIIACKAECEANFDMVVFGQPGREADMHTLSVILRDAYAGKPLPPHIDNYTEGRILGYSDRDIALWNRDEQPNALMSWFLQKTSETRRDIRTALMKEAGPNWSRNP